MECSLFCARSSLLPRQDLGEVVAVLGRGGRDGSYFWERWSQFLGEVRLFCRDLSRGKCLSGVCGADCLGEVPIILLHLSQNTLPPLPKPHRTSPGSRSPVWPGKLCGNVSGAFLCPEMVWMAVRKRFGGVSVPARASGTHNAGGLDRPDQQPYPVCCEGADPGNENGI